MVDKYEHSFANDGAGYDAFDGTEVINQASKDLLYANLLFFSQLFPDPFGSYVDETNGAQLPRVRGAVPDFEQLPPEAADKIQQELAQLAAAVAAADEA